jgi:hypothetical protein
MDRGLMAILRRASETVGLPDPAATPAMIFDCEVMSASADRPGQRRRPSNHRCTGPADEVI